MSQSKSRPEQKSTPGIRSVFVVLVVLAANIAAGQEIRPKGKGNISNACEWAIPKFGKYPQIVKTKVQRNGHEFFVPTHAVGIAFCHLKTKDGKIDWNSNSGPRLLGCALIAGEIPPATISNGDYVYNASGCRASEERAEIRMFGGQVENAQKSGPTSAIVHPHAFQEIDIDSCHQLAIRSPLLRTGIFDEREEEYDHGKYYAGCVVNTTCNVTVDGQKSRSTIIAACNRVKNEESGKYECPRTLKECMDAGPFTVNADFEDDEKMSLRTKAPSTLSVFLSQRRPEIKHPWRVFKTSIAALGVSLTALLGCASLLRRFV